MNKMERTIILAIGSIALAILKETKFYKMMSEKCGKYFEML